MKGDIEMKAFLNIIPRYGCHYSRSNYPNKEYMVLNSALMFILKDVILKKYRMFLLINIDDSSQKKMNISFKGRTLET